MTCPRSHLQGVSEQGVDPSQDVSEVCGLSSEPGSGGPGSFSARQRVATQYRTKMFQEASGGQSWPTLSGKEFQNQESRPNVFSLTEGCQRRMSGYKSCNAHTHRRSGWTLCSPTPGLRPQPWSLCGGQEVSGVVSLPPRHSSMNPGCHCRDSPKERCR